LARRVSCFEVSIIANTLICGGVEGPESGIAAIDAGGDRDIAAGVTGRVTGNTREIVIKELSDAYALIGTVECSALGT
jgi:hypothetical protein